MDTFGIVCSIDTIHTKYMYIWPPHTYTISHITMHKKWSNKGFLSKSKKKKTRPCEFVHGAMSSDALYLDSKCYFFLFFIFANSLRTLATNKICLSIQFFFLCPFFNFSHVFVQLLSMLLAFSIFIFLKLH